MIKGLVQGVGFRPFICRLASIYGLYGNVDNRSNGVYINVEGEEKAILRFRDHIIHEPPPASRIKSVELKRIKVKGRNEFIITGSLNGDKDITEISPDIAICANCLSDIETDPARIDYPFTNCTNCGPRFTIIEGLPYDRIMTSMNVFDMCDKCTLEYRDPLNRRFHAQPIACNNCGPFYSYESESGTITQLSSIISEFASRISAGNSVAVKGVGGYHLVCDAMNNQAVKELRSRKKRDAKPFAVMFRDLNALSEYCMIDNTETSEITSWRRPVLILKQKKILSDSVSNGLNTVGALLPYMPLHFMLFRKLETCAIILTSGNLSDEPLIKDDNKARESLRPVTGVLLTYNREIVNRADDSVMRIIGNSPSLIRRSRGFVPEPVDLGSTVEGILSMGPEQKSTFSIGKGRQAIMSQHIGDLKNPQTFEFFSESLNNFFDLFRFKPSIIACDLHPSYFSTVLAEKLAAENNIPLIRVQHHHAHIASCMAEHHLTGRVIGVSMDGTGLGTDGNIWGGEFMIAGYDGFTRITHFDYVPLPGGDKVIDEPWRVAFSYLYKYFGNEIDYSSIPAFLDVPHDQLNLVRQMIDKRINCPLSSGAGRLFDAVSAITGLCSTSQFDSEAPVRLESAITSETDDLYQYDAGDKVVFSETLREIIGELGKTDISVISAKFHNTVAAAIADVTARISRETSIMKVVLSGGLFQNKYLTERTLKLLLDKDFEVFVNRQVPSNDGGISLGQLMVASKSDKYVFKYTS